MNNEFFKPRGLYCLIMTYMPDSSEKHESVDVTEQISSSINLPSSGMKQVLSHMRLSSGKTYGELELPEAAPLIFPALDQLAENTSEEGLQKQGQLKKSQKFIADYFDRRAQATYAADNPGSALTVPQSTPFASRYVDPNHAANNGSLLSLVTGGAVDRRGRRQARRYARREEKAIRRGEEVPPQTQTRRKKGGLVKRILKKVSFSTVDCDAC
jgi:hypothetical protein